MIVNPFWAGVASTLLFEALTFIGMVILAAYQYSKKDRKVRLESANFKVELFLMKCRGILTTSL